MGTSLSGEEVSGKFSGLQFSLLSYPTTRGFVCIVTNVASQ